MDHTDHTDQDLARSIRSGDKDAFVALVRRYERPLSALVRDRLGSGEAVEDVLQETLTRAWSGLRVQEPKNVRAWLYQVARNRCSDHLRSRQRRERIVEPEELARTVNRMGVADARRRRSAEAVVDALEAVPEQERRALRAFYLDGMSIAEIAARHRCPPGTVKRRLSHGRDRVRRELGITGTRRGITMRVDNRTAAKLPFPDRRPEITVSRSTGQPFSIDLRELAWWFIVPEIGERVRWAEYEQTLDGSAPKLTEVNSIVARRPAIVHGTGVRGRSRSTNRRAAIGPVWSGSTILGTKSIDPPGSGAGWTTRRCSGLLTSPPERATARRSYRHSSTRAGSTTSARWTG